MSLETKTCFQPTRWYVAIEFQPASGQPVTLGHHPCESRAHGREVLTEAREALAFIADWVPGLRAVGYELSEPVQVPSALASLPAEPAGGRDARWWAQAIGLRVPQE